jgi:hypothetical protein
MANQCRLILKLWPSAAISMVRIVAAKKECAPTDANGRPLGIRGASPSKVTQQQSYALVLRAATGFCGQVLNFCWTNTKGQKAAENISISVQNTPKTFPIYVKILFVGSAFGLIGYYAPLPIDNFASELSGDKMHIMSSR